MKDVRIAVAALTLSAAGFAAWVQHEGFGPVTVRADGVEVLKPYVPTQGDVPTIGEPKRFRVLRSGGGKTKLSDKTVTIAVTNRDAVFQDGNKWRFNDGQTTFNAVILDGDFLARVDEGERFGKGDALQVEMQVIQNKGGGEGEGGSHRGQSAQPFLAARAGRARFRPSVLGRMKWAAKLASAPPSAQLPQRPPLTSEGRQPPPLDLLADLFGLADARAGDLARIADELGATGASCERWAEATEP